MAVLRGEEPAQSAERRVTVKRPGEIGNVLIAHKLPDGRAADQPALDVLDAVLSNGKSSRLYRALVDSGLALDASAFTDLRHPTRADIVINRRAYAGVAEGTEAGAEERMIPEVLDLRRPDR